ncbi:nucleotide pyrophosphohydrolase [Leptospira bourretii]|uniref:nucleoside triphosphate pyrophosphohydrolase family protein n=1 Tax=Leptospira bourretii TaxID=2484962 RepID=UPI00109161FC|nr:nucleoside triphosphate pyrophosphohydrolase family protein [Leptospira bourretii]TGL18563.1 nucleotide pyrophosphohydrolase [Leptospira bourretii]
MDFNEYQISAEETNQKHIQDDTNKYIIPFLGVIGEIGSLVSQLKIRLRDGDSHLKFKENIGEEIGDILWYLSTIATQYDLNLNDLAERNLLKVKDRFLSKEIEYFEFDEEFPLEERLPEEFEIRFHSFEEDGKKKVRILNNSTQLQVADVLTDNTYLDDGYRFHDIFHFGYLAILGWSPVLRKQLCKKRKSDPIIDENEDGQRAQIIEELVSLFIYIHAEEHNLLKSSKIVDTSLIKKVKSLVSSLEVKKCSGKHWEKAILNSYEVFNKLRENEGGRVLVSKKNRSLTYLGKY